MIIDMSPTSIGRFIIATGAAAGWLITSAVTQEAPEVPESQPSVARPIETGGVPPAQLSDALRERLAEPVLPERGRNPFTYGARAAAPSRDGALELSEPDATIPAEPAAAPLPVFKLSGIASSRQDGVLVLTAIVIDNGTMVFAKTGDSLSNGYSVVRVDETSITLADAAGITQTIRLP